jgi:hypothetical protein
VSGRTAGRAVRLYGFLETKEDTMAGKRKDLDPKGRAKRVRGGDDRQNIENSWNNITKRDVPNLVDAATLGVVKMRPGKAMSVKP